MWRICRATVSGLPIRIWPFSIRHIHAETGAGVLDLIPGPPHGDKALKSIELIGTKLMPLVRELN